MNPKPACKHCGGATEPRFILCTNGQKQYRLQCLACNEEASLNLKQSVAFEWANGKPIVEFAKEEMYAGRTAKYERQREQRIQDREREAEAWWDRYDDYLLSEAWRKRRAAVLLRDGNRCTACRARPATQVHHLTYDHAGDEPLFDLTSVCDDCHERITASDRLRRSTGKRPIDMQGGAA